MKWPSCSPDLNPIEHVWNDVDIRIREHPQPENKSELKEIIIEEWYKTSNQYIQNSYHSLPRRCNEVIRANGGHTKY